MSDDRDKDWTLAIGYALGFDSGFNIPIVPEPREFNKLFDAIAAEARKMALEDIIARLKDMNPEYYDAAIFMTRRLADSPAKEDG